MFLLTCDKKKLTKSQFRPTHVSTKRKITDELKHNAGWYEVREGISEGSLSNPLEFTSGFVLDLSKACPLVARWSLGILTRLPSA